MNIEKLDKTIEKLEDDVIQYGICSEIIGADKIIALAKLIEARTQVELVEKRINNTFK